MPENRPYMTRKQYIQHVQRCADRYWVDDNYTWEDYKRDTDEENFTILPLDLEKFTAILDETKKWINILFKDEDEDADGNYMLRGSCIGDSLMYVEKNRLNLTYGDYGNYYSYFAYNDAEMLIYTFCEGDTTLTLFMDRESYMINKADTQKWYAEHYA